MAVWIPTHLHDKLDVMDGVRLWICPTPLKLLDYYGVYNFVIGHYLHIVFYNESYRIKKSMTINGT